MVSDTGPGDTTIVNPHPPVMLLMGPTAAGKTAVATALYRSWPCDVISVDSALVYRRMDIGTAKPTPTELSETPHQLVNVCEPWDSYSASRFRADAVDAIAASHAAGRLPLLVGGTMLYYRALMDGLSILPAANADIRQELEAQARIGGWASMHRRLAGIDPVAAQRIHPNDPQRIQRALEVWEISGRSLTDLQRSQAARRWPGLLLRHALWPEDRALLHARIEQRFEQMLNDGFIAEVESLKADARMHGGLPSMRCVGYRQVWSYLDGELNLPQMKDKSVAATRQLAKRQFTWMRSMESLSCYDVDAESVASVAMRMRQQVVQQLHEEQRRLRQCLDNQQPAGWHDAGAATPARQQATEASDNTAGSMTDLATVYQWIDDWLQKLES